MNKYYVTLGEVCSKGSSNIAQKDLDNNDGIYPIFGASGFIKNVDFYKHDKEYLAIVKDGAGIGRVMLLPAYSSVIGTLQYIFPNEKVDIKFLYYALIYMNLSKYFTGATIPENTTIKCKKGKRRSCTIFFTVTEEVTELDRRIL